MRITLTIEGASEAANLLEATASRLEQPPAPLLEALAAALTTAFQNHIRHHTGPEGPWPPLHPVTQKIRAFYGHPPDDALVRSGDLLQSLTTLRQEDAAVEVGTITPFARTLQDGGTVTDPKTGRTRTVQAFPFVYVTADEVQTFADLLKEHYFGA